jgi:glycosyltransferase involved in cell wall biosynthesis
VSQARGAVLKIWDAEYPWDVRTEKVCQALTGAGYAVHMVARNRDGRALEEKLPECTVHRLAPFRALGARVNAASQFPAFFNPRWTSRMREVGRRERAQVVLVRDLPLAPAAINVAKQLQLPVVLDMAENYPAMIRDLWTTGATRLGDRLVRNPKMVEAVENWVLPRLDHCVVVVEESRDRLIKLGVPADRVTVVSNTPAQARIDEYAALRDAATALHADAPLRLTYLGLMEEARGVRLVLDAVALMAREGVVVALDLIGDGRARKALEAHATELGLDPARVRFFGHVPYRDALKIVAEADAGLIPHYANESWETTIPNKLFDYMSLGLSVISSDVTPVVRVLSETGAGVTFKDRNAGDLARVLRSLDRNTARAQGVKGRQSVRSRYHWERDAEHLVAVLDGVIAGRKKSR